MNILALKLVTGEEVLGEIESQDETYYVLSNPVGISIVRGPDGQPSVGFTPFPLHAEQKKDSTLDLKKSHVLYSYVPAKEFITNYNQIFGSGIVLPPTKQLIVG